jgi:hypothetical protein
MEENTLGENIFGSLELQKEKVAKLKQNQIGKNTMDLVRNLKTTLKNLAEKILVELSYHYIKQRAKQTMKRHDNSSSIMSSSNLLTTESQRSIIATSYQDTSEKTIMTATTEDIVAHVRTWSLDRAADKSISKTDARAILAEFYEWIEPEDDELEIVSLEPET